MITAEETHNLDELLGLDRYEIDRQTHIHINAGLCDECQTHACLIVCPAQVYKLVEGKIIVRHENCLECGACHIVCNTRTRKCVEWTNPRGGYGIAFRYG